LPEPEAASAPVGQAAPLATRGQHQAAPDPAAAERELVRASIREGAALSRTYLIMNCLAAVVATYGLLQDSAAVVIGAMIIAMLLGPIAGIALALVEGDSPLLVRSLVAEVAGVAVVLATSYSIARMHGGLPLGKEVLARTAPNILDLAVALAAGAAGALGTISPRAYAGLVGVAIATALVPPLCSSAICLSRGMTGAAAGGGLLFLTNLVAIQCATSAVLVLHGYAVRTRLRGLAFARRFGPSVVLLGVIAVFLGYGFQRGLEQQAFRANAERALRAEVERSGAARLAEVRIGPGNVAGWSRVTAVVRAPWIIVPGSCARMQSAVRQATGRDQVELRVRTVLTRECDASRFLWEDAPGATDDFADGPL